MQTQPEERTSSRVRVRNIGGIDEAAVTFSPGVTVLVGRNASNRTSLLQGVMAGVGSTNVSIKADTDRAEVTLEFGEDTYTRTLSRDGAGLEYDGQPYLSEPDVADLFAFLLERNDCRTAVAQGGNLRDLIMAPIDTESIESEIEATLRRRQELEEKISAIESKQSALTELSREREQLKEQISEKKSELSRVRERIDDAEAAASHEQQEEAERKLEELNSVRDTLEDVRYQLETEQESLDASQSEYDDLKAELAELPSVDGERIEDLEAEVSRLRDRKSRLDAETSSLQNVVQFNERMLDSDQPTPFETVAAAGQERAATSEGDAAVTDQLVTDEEARCWTCGTEVQAEQIEETLEQLRDISQEQRSIVAEIQSDIDELTDTIETLQDKQDQGTRLTSESNRSNRN